MRYFSIKLKNYLLLSFITLGSPGLSQPIDLSLEWTTNSNIPFLTELENTIEDEIAVLPTVKGIIVIYKGQVVLENYYHGSSVDDVYNIWSVTKSFMSTLIGQAVDMGMMDDPDSSASNFFPDYDIDYVESIKLHHLLGMSSGYEENWGFLTNSTEEILSGNASGPGTFFYNNNACHLNAHALYHTTGQTPYEFANMYLFPYLGIVEPSWSSGYLGINNGSYGLQLNLRSMVKLGQLYIQDGFSGNEQILSAEWIERSTSPQVDTNWGNYGYGYLWWLPEIGFSYQANGAGGQLISVFPDYDLVVGTHSDGDSQALQTAIHNQIAPIFDRPSIAINEILASNNGCCLDEYGENNHYIELYNFGNDTIDVAGFFLTNDVNDYNNYAQIQTGSDSTKIAPGEFLLIWSDDTPTQGILHLDALLSNTGGQLALYGQDTSTIVDLMSYSIQAPDMAYAREQDGGGDWMYMDPTPGLSNITIMSIKEGTIQPKSFKLAQNYPNPFNPTTNISFELLEDASVTIQIFDVSGRMIKELISGNYSVGGYTTQWDARDERGQLVSAGVYMYTIQVGNDIFAKKMVLLK